MRFYLSDLKIRDANRSATLPSCAQTPGTICDGTKGFRSSFLCLLTIRICSFWQRWQYSTGMIAPEYG